MAMTSTPVFEQTPKNAVVRILPADTTTLKTLYTAGANGSTVYHINVTSSDTSAKDLQFWVNVDGTDQPLFTVSCPANSGFTNSVAVFTLLNNVRVGTQLTDSNGNPCLYLGAGSILKVKALSNVTTAKQINVFAQIGDF